MSIESIINEAFSIASEFGLACEVIDVTNNTASARLYLDKDIFIQVYVNQVKGKSFLKGKDFMELMLKVGVIIFTPLRSQIPIFLPKKRKT